MTLALKPSILRNLVWSLADPRIRAAVVCLAIAAVYLFVWPGRSNPERVALRPLWRRIVLRWFHSLFWVVAAVACVLWSKVAVVAALAVYLIFLIALMLERRSVAGK